MLRRSRRLVLVLAVLAGVATIGVVSAPHAHASGAADLELCALCASSHDAGALDLQPTIPSTTEAAFEWAVLPARRAPAIRATGRRLARAPPQLPCTH